MAIDISYRSCSALIILTVTSPSIDMSDVKPKNPHSSPATLDYKGPFQYMYPELWSSHCLTTLPNSEESEPESKPRIVTIHTFSPSLPFELKRDIIRNYIHGPEPSLAILHGIQTSSNNK